MIMGYIVSGPAAVVQVGDVHRYLETGAPVPEGATKASIDHLTAVGLITEVDDVATEPTDAGPKSIDDMKVDELKAYAAEKDINLGDAKTKDAILTAIRAAEVTGGQSA